MSQSTVPARLNRSQLAVPGSSPRFIEKAATSPADVVFMDLEDAVAPPDKETARKTVIAATRDVDWGDKTLSIRINAMDTPFRKPPAVPVTHWFDPES